MASLGLPTRIHDLARNRFVYSAVCESFLLSLRYVLHNAFIPRASNNNTVTITSLCTSENCSTTAQCLPTSTVYLHSSKQVAALSELCFPFSAYFRRYSTVVAVPPDSLKLAAHGSSIYTQGSYKCHLHHGQSSWHHAKGWPRFTPADSKKANGVFAAATNSVGTQIYSGKTVGSRYLFAALKRDKIHHPLVHYLKGSTVIAMSFMLKLTRTTSMNHSTMS